jgi:hypothetical protein
MDDSETEAQAYLTHLGFKKIIYEPEGKSRPPDFLVDQRIAVEVRRLNQHEVRSQAETRSPGLEEVAIPVWEHIQSLLPSLGPPKAGLSWYIHISYSRPVPKRRALEDAARRHLEAFRDGVLQNPTTIRVFENFTIELFRAGRLYSDYFVMGGRTDFDSGGWVIPELERNLKICIDDKTAKVSAIRGKYSEWWLALIDHINYGADKAIRVPPHNWDKIILINPLDPTKAFEIR